MNMSRRASYVTMIVGALVAWADIDTELIAATRFGLILLAGGAVIAIVEHLVARWTRLDRPCAESSLQWPTDAGQCREHVAMVGSDPATRVNAL